MRAMKNSLTCPKCQSRKLWRIEKFRTGPDIGGELPVAAWRRRGVLGTSTGHFDVYICVECGYTEFFVEDFGELKPNPKRGFHLIDNSPRQAGYR